MELRVKELLDRPRSYNSMSEALDDDIKERNIWDNVIWDGDVHDNDILHLEDII